MLELQSNEVMVDYRVYNIPPEFTKKTWANKEKLQPYITLVNSGNAKRPWCRLCGKFGECDNHNKGQDHLKHLLLPTGIYSTLTSGKSLRRGRDN